MIHLTKPHLHSVYTQVKHSKYLQWMLLILLMGITLRICLFAIQRSLWLDEALLARNIIDRPLLALLFQPLDYNQGAPVLFLMVYKSLHDMATNPDKRQREHILPLLQILDEQRQTDEPLYIYYGSMHAYLYYQAIQQRNDDPLYIGGRHRGDPEAYLAEIDELTQYPAVWFLFSHNIVYEGINEEKFILEYLNQIGTQRKRFDQTGASLYYYEFQP